MTDFKRIIGGLAMLAILMVSTGCGAKATATPTPTATPTAAVNSTPAPTETLPPIPTIAIATSAAQPTSQATPTGQAVPAGQATPTGAAGHTPVPAATNPPASGTSAPDKYQFLGQSIPDGRQYLPHAPISVTWTIKNTGTTTWSKTYSMRFFAGPTGSGPATVPFGKSVPPGAAINLNVTITTPAGIGDYDTWYKLTNDQFQNFGDLDFKYTVSNEPNNSFRPTATP